MANQADILLDALDYIEDNIVGEISVQNVADSCYVSVSGLQKTFSYVFHMSVKEYIIRRRFSCAAKDLLQTENSILDIALKYGYSSAESFTRGFRKIWGITPSEYRRTRHFAGHTPRLAIPGDSPIQFMEDGIMSRVKYDLTELYDVIIERKNCAYVCADLERLMWINDNLGRDAGDAALNELMRRVDGACNEDDIVLRIGGDEFVVFTNSREMEHANEIVKKVSAQNGQTVRAGDVDVAVSVHIGAFQKQQEQRVDVPGMFHLISEGMKEIHK